MISGGLRPPGRSGEVFELRSSMHRALSVCRCHLLGGVLFQEDCCEGFLSSSGTWGLFSPGFGFH